MKETEIIKRYREVREKAAANGITLLVGDDGYYFNDIQKATGSVIFKTLAEVETFVYGYSLGYKSGL